MNKLTSFYHDLRRRRVFAVVALYVVAAWVVIQVGDLTIEAGMVAGLTLRNLFVLAIIGFPLALIAGWFYDITKKGIVRTAPTGADESFKTSLQPKDYLLLLVLLVIWSGAYVYVHTPPVVEKSIAVMPFKNRGNDPENAQFAFGIHDDLMTQLQRVGDLKLIARTSVSKIDPEASVQNTGLRLGAAYIMKGSVERVLDRIRVSVVLIDAAEAQETWSGTFDRELSAINQFDIRDEITSAITENLQVVLSPDENSRVFALPTANTEAYKAYLMGRYLVVKRGRANIEGAIREFEKAIEHDPDYALAHAELAMALIRSGRNDGMPDTEANARATPHAERAMVLDPNLAEAHAATGYLLWHRWDQWDQLSLENALTHFERATQINPNYSKVYTWMASLLKYQLERYAEAFTALETALQLNPLSISARADYVEALINRNRLEEAEHELEKLAVISPANYLALHGALISHGGQWANAVLTRLDYLQAYPKSGWTRILLSRRFASIGLGNEALAIYEKTWPITLSMLGRPADAVKIAETRFAENMNVEVWEGSLGYSLAAAGDYTRARPILEKMWQFSGKRVGMQNTLFDIHIASALIAIRRDAGEEDGVDELVAAIWDDVHRIREAGITGSEHQLVINPDYEEGLVEYLAGDRERGLSLIAMGAENGYFIPQKEAFLQILYDDPGFAPIRANQEAKQIRERNKFLTIVCSDNPYVDVWQPEEGTCERWAAEGENGR